MNGLPDLEEVQALRQQLAKWLLVTPVLRCAALESTTGAAVHAKLEFMQRTGTFKPRGALSVLLDLDEAQLAAGVTAVSAGNHAIAVAFAARQLGSSARVVMPRTANPLRVRRCQDFGAEVILADDAHEAFARAETIRDEEGRYLVHPFEGPRTTLGTATLGAELCEQTGDFDVLLLPIGGGGLCSGVASVVRQLRPSVRILGVEPEGADTMHRSFASGRPEAIDEVRTIADSLGAPWALPYSFSLCRQTVDELVRVSDEQLSAAMRFLFRDMKIAVEPACAATTAALLGPLRGKFSGLRIATLFCGSNIDWPTFARDARLEQADAA